MACTVAMQHALTESLLVTMEEWPVLHGGHPSQWA